MVRALVVEDDHSIRRQLVDVLKELGLTVDSASTLDQAIALAEDGVYRLVLVDLRLQDGSGFDALTRFGRFSIPPVMIVVSSTMDVTARNRSIELGARDFISKPFHHDEVARRLQRALKPRTPPASATQGRSLLAVGAVQLDLRQSIVTNGARKRRLTGPEANLVELLMRRPGLDIPVDEMARRLWPDDRSGPRRVRRLLRRLIRKVEHDPSAPVWIRRTGERLARFAAPEEAAGGHG